VIARARAAGHERRDALGIRTIDTQQLGRRAEAIRRLAARSRPPVRALVTCGFLRKSIDAAPRRSRPPLEMWRRMHAMRERGMTKKPGRQVATDVYHEHPSELQHYESIVSVPIALDAAVRSASVGTLDRVLALNERDRR